MVVGDLSSLQDDAETDPVLLRHLINIYMTVHWLAMSNSFVNPLIYGFLNNEFRVGLLYLKLIN